VIFFITGVLNINVFNFVSNCVLLVPRITIWYLAITKLVLEILVQRFTLRIAFWYDHTK